MVQGARASRQQRGSRCRESMLQQTDTLTVQIVCVSASSHATHLLEGLRRHAGADFIQVTSGLAVSRCQMQTLCPKLHEVPCLCGAANHLVLFARYACQADRMASCTHTLVEHCKSICSMVHSQAQEVAMVADSKKSMGMTDERRLPTSTAQELNR